MRKYKYVEVMYIRNFIYAGDQIIDYFYVTLDQLSGCLET